MGCEMVFLELLAFILPCYVANAAPVLVGGGMRLDMGIKLGDGMGLLGKTKTIRGFLGGVAAGAIVSGIVAAIWPGLLFGNQQTLFLAGVMLAVGALIGDAAGSFIKRRMRMKPGKHFNFLDQMDFIIGGLLFAYPFASRIYSLENIVFIVVVSYVLHVGANVSANKLGLKKVPW
ncbi:CDP-2,3-bis-(O-geranylgeranyl)-sn-glycerol synthase [Candidatus Micrarchaeota archaeon]|nr:CDP-2,3-bis-(O-geranylgeranyl)-sn-glycerol synthase [Candidatus Micrarchaeota archaeon]MBD3418193.1 CDP-2,3-bis-(O-geranylgeranyl)-sn-glycerol synthase [Candidatus Micrarchaeota archaeon]